MIVNKHFQTTDRDILAAGPLCEFSRRYKAQCPERKLRMENWNSREVGLRLATLFVEAEEKGNVASLPQKPPKFFLPKGIGGMIIGGYY